MAIERRETIKWGEQWNNRDISKHSAISYTLYKKASYSFLSSSFFFLFFSCYLFHLSIVRHSKSIFMLRITFIPHVNLPFHFSVSIHLPLSLLESLSLYGKNEIFVFV